MEKMAVLAPMPRASDRTAATESNGLALRARPASRRSCMSSDSVKGQGRRDKGAPAARARREVAEREREGVGPREQ